MRTRSRWYALAASVCLPLVLCGGPITEGKSVTLVGLFGVVVDGPPNWDPPYWFPHPLADPSTLVDGIFLPPGNPWQDDTVWWDARYQPSAYNSILIDLGAPYSIASLVVQADGNDAYLLEYKTATGGWAELWTVPIMREWAWGLRTRPDEMDNTQRYQLPVAVITTALRFSPAPIQYGDGGDLFYAVSEIQAFGDPADPPAPQPEPGTLAMFGIAAAAGFAFRALRRRARRSAV